MRGRTFVAVAVSLAALCAGTDVMAKDEPELERVQEVKLASLLQRPGERFEASAVYALGDSVYVLFDNRTEVAVLSKDLARGELKPLATTWRGADFEGLTYDPVGKRFYAVIEAERVGAKTFRSRLIELDPNFKEVASWTLLPDLADPGKGIEGLAHVRRNGKLYLLGQMEGNHGLGGKKGKDKGNGRVRVYERSGDGWSHVTTLELPKAARLSDYAGIDVRPDGRIAVVSQKSSKVWVGKLSKNDWTVVGPGTLYRFPRPKGEKIYDAVEGICWLDDRRFIVSSDGARDRAGVRQSESIQVFQLPR